MSKSDALDSSIGLELLNGRATWLIWKNRKLETIVFAAIDERTVSRN